MTLNDKDVLMYRYEAELGVHAWVAHEQVRPTGHNWRKVFWLPGTGRFENREDRSRPIAADRFRWQRKSMFIWVARHECADFCDTRSELILLRRVAFVNACRRRPGRASKRQNKKAR
jgi:hypothetical protein